MIAGWPWVVADGGATLRVRVTPKAGRERIDGVRETADGTAVLAVRVRAAPDKGAANRALVALVAKGLRLPRSSICVSRGATARLKTLRIDNAPDDLLDRLTALVE